MSLRKFPLKEIALSAERWTEEEDGKMGGNLAVLHGSEGCDQQYKIQLLTSARGFPQDLKTSIDCNISSIAGL